MKTSRIKSIVIVVLALVNVFLLVLLLSRQHQQGAAYDRSVEQLSLLLSENGIALDPALLPQEASLPFAVLSRNTDAERALAQSLLGDSSFRDVGGGICVYQNASGFLQFHANGAVDGTVNTAAEDPAAFCQTLLRDYGYVIDESAQETSVIDEHGSGTIRMVRQVEDRPLFHAPLSFTFEKNILTAVSGSFLPGVSVAKSGGGVSAVSALVRFLDYRNANGIVCTEIRLLEAGYLLQESASPSAKLLPVWHIRTDISDYYVNYSTGELLRT